MSMYRLMLYYLVFLIIWAAALSFAKLLPYGTFDILGSTVYLVAICWFTNKLFARVFKVSTNPESSLISALILSLIIKPGSLVSNFSLLTFVAVFAMASKYLVVWKGRHVFNPTAFGVVVTALILGQGASWWVGTPLMLPAILIGGLLVLRKLRRYELVGIFLIFYMVFTLNSFPNNLIYSPVIFFALVMLVEPLTSPTIKKWQIVYSGLVAVVIFTYQRFLTDIFYSFELALLTGNIFSYLVSQNFRQVLRLREKQKLSHDVIAFLFEPWKKFQFSAGQYLEWTLPHPYPDNRGIRRYFTIASSPTENSIILVTKFYEKQSTFKQALVKFEPGDEIVVSDLGGEFTTPADSEKKLVFIAGGIGITPFRSMARWMIDKKESRDVVLLFSNKTSKDIVFKNIFKEAEKIGWETIYVNTDEDGYIDEKVISEKVPDWKDRIFYVSGPEPMVEAFEKMLAKMGIAKSQVKRDYFPGYTETHQK